MDRSFKVDKARRLLGYEPKYDLRAGINATARGYEAAGLL
jgi:nucleoside-diphosphate-sugar epimerase